MNIGQANAIPLSDILEKIGCQPVKRNGADIWYNSPLRSEKTASFHIHTGKNAWYDFGEAKGGSTVDLVRAYLKSHNEDNTLVDALRWLRNMTGTLPPVAVVRENLQDKAAALTAHKIAPLKKGLFTPFLESRGIPLNLARRYLKEIHVRNHQTGKYFYALGLANESGNYELRNQFFKGTIGPKTISFVRGRDPLSGEIHVFEGMMDFLAAAIYQKEGQFEGDAIVLNSVSCAGQVMPYLRGYSYKTLYSWMDNDTAGEKASETLMSFANESQLVFVKMNRLYKQHKDVNEWHLKRLEAKKQPSLG